MTDGKHENQPSGPVLSERAYNILKWVSLTFLPGFGTAYFGLAQLWPLPYPEQVVGSVVILGTFLGVTLGVSNRNFQKQGADGQINAVVNGDTVELSRISLPDIAPEELAKKSQIVLQVNPSQRSH